MSRPNRSGSDSSDPGAAQFITNLSERQLQHLQFSVPAKGKPERFSQFLEEPRQVPVPKRFTFDVRTLERLKENNESARHIRNESGKSSKSSKSVKSKRSEASISEAGSGGSIGRGSVDLLKEVERVATEKVATVDWRFYSTGVCLCMLNLIAAWDVTTLSITLPVIATALHGSTIDTYWLAISFLVAATCFLPLFSTFSGIFGRKPMLLTALIFFTIGSFIAAVTSKFTGLHLGRSVQGIGAGGIYVLSNLIVSDLLSTIDRKKWSAIIGATWALGAVTGPLIGGALADRGQWRWIFWLNLPFCGLAFLFLPFFAQLKPAMPGSILLKLRNVDWVGFVLFTGSLVSVLLGLTWGGTVHAWGNFQTILPIQFGLIGLLIFLIWTWFSPFPSLIRVDGFSDPTHAAMYLGAFAQGMLVYSALYFLPLFFSVAKPSHSLVETGVCLLAWSLPLVIFALMTFFVITMSTFLRPMIWFGWFLTVLGFALMTIFTRTSGTVMWLCIAVFSGSGIGVLYPSLATASILSSQFGSEDGKLARTVTNHAFFQTFGSTLGVAVSSSIFQNQLYKKLLKNPVLLTKALTKTKDAFRMVKVIRDNARAQSTLTMQVADTYVDSMRLIWVVMAAVAGAALLASFFIKRAKPRNDQEIELKTVDPGYAV